MMIRRGTRWQKVGTENRARGKEPRQEATRVCKWKGPPPSPDPTRPDPALRRKSGVLVNLGSRNCPVKKLR